MKREDISDALDVLDDDLIEQTGAVRNKKEHPYKKWRKWGTLAACAGIILVAVRILPDLSTNMHSGNIPDVTGGKKTAVEDDNTSEFTGNESLAIDDIAYEFGLNAMNYFPISFEERIRYGLVEKDAVGLTAENTYQITKDDLGEAMGRVENSEDKSLVGCTVYHFASFPDNDAICIVDKKGAYAFYVADGIALSDEIGQNFNRVLEAYNMPESVTELEIQTGDWQTVLTITDKEDISTICALLSDKENIGLQANEKRYAKLWYDTYGNQDVYYNGETMSYSEDSDYDKAHTLWSKGERVVWITTDRGLRFYFLYTPSIQTFECYGFYALSGEQAKQMNTLLSAK